MKQNSAKRAVFAAVSISGAISALVFTTLNAPPRHVELMAINKHWRTYVNVERLQVINESIPQTSNNNESALPVDAYNIEYRIESNCNTQRLVVDNTPAPLVVSCTDKRTVAYYQVNRWIFDRVLEITGHYLQDIRFPPLIMNKSDCLDCYREMARGVEYFVDFQYGAETVIYTAIDRAQWESIGIEMKYAVRLDTAQNIDWSNLTAR